MDIHTVLTGSSGRTYTLTKELGKGGEGSVFKTSFPNSVAKIYDDTKPGAAEKMDQLEKKLLYMVNTIQMRFISKVSRNCLVSWPQDVLYLNGKFVGYIMPEITGAKSILLVNRGGESAKKVIPDYSWKKAALVAENLAKVVCALHNLDVIIGDMNNNNILVYPNCDVAIIDTDSFDIREKDRQTHYKCSVGVGPYLPPELHGCVLSDPDTNFTKHTDEFALAVHIFQLLMANKHPFGIRLIQNRSSKMINTDYNISVGNCAYIRNISGCTVPVGAPRMQHVLPQTIIQDFAASFDYHLDKNRINYEQQLAAVQNRRTSAAKWLQDLHEMNQQLDSLFVPCPHRSKIYFDHYYLREQGCCGICEAENEERRVAERITLHSNSSPTPNPPPTPYPPPNPTPTPNPHPNPNPRPTPNPSPNPNPRPTPNPPPNPNPTPTPNPPPNPQPTPKENLNTIVFIIALFLLILFFIGWNS